MNREQWLEDRKKGIGGSEVAAILGLDEYKTPLQVWHDKTGRSSKQPQNPYMKFGNKVEKIIVEYWEEETELKTEECGHLAHPDYDFILGTPDRLYSKNGVKGVLECKTTKLMITPDDPRFMKFFCQLQWYMSLASAPIGEIAVLNRVDCEFTRFEFELDLGFCQEILGKVVVFWQNHVLSDIPPEPQNGKDIEKLFKKHMNGKYIEATQETLKIVENLKCVKEKAKELESQEKQLIEQIKMVLKDSEFLIYGDKPIITWKSEKDREKFDSSAFKEAHPDLWNQFKKTVPGSRRFSIK